MGLVLSPARAAPIEIDSSSDENDAPRAPVKRPTVGLKSARKKATPPVPPSPKNNPPSDDYDVDMGEMDDGFLEALEKVEAEAQSTAPGPSHAASGRRQVDSDSVITIDDDEEMEDKENVPAPQRHVRRRVLGETRSLGQVIDISSD
jgi:hypothetical protein